MTNEELDEARAKEAWRIWNEEDGVTDEGHAVIAARLACENWTPPEPVVDPDLLAYREWEVSHPCPDYYRKEVLEGKRDYGIAATAYLAGARMAREQEQADIHIPVIAVELATRFRHLLHSLPLNVRVQLGVKWDLDDAFVSGVEVTLAKYRGEA